MEESDAFLAALFFHVWLKFSCWLIDPSIRALLSLFPARFAPVLASMGRKKQSHTDCFARFSAGPATILTYSVTWNPCR